MSAFIGFIIIGIVLAVVLYLAHKQTQRWENKHGKAGDRTKNR